MNRVLAEKVADAVLYEGYMLYPYRQSAIKNRQRWSFGILYPPAYDEVRTGTERAQMHSECIVVPRNKSRVDVLLRFLHLSTQQVFEVHDNVRKAVQSVGVYGSVVESRQQGDERRTSFEIDIADNRSSQREFCFPSSSQCEATNYGEEEVMSEIERRNEEIKGTVTFSCMRIGPDAFKVTIDVANSSILPVNANTRDDALLRSMLSAHLILSIEGGEFVSSLDPPERYSEAVKSCNNVGNLPVLVGDEGERDMMLCSPILLYDYPRIAPESAGDFFDATEMDEMLTLRVMTLTDAEKGEVRSGDQHARSLLERTEQMAREQLQRTHGIIRSFRPMGEGHD